MRLRNLLRRASAAGPVLGIAGLALLLAAAPAPALAGGGHSGRGHGHGHFKHHKHGPPVRHFQRGHGGHRPFVVPHTIRYQKHVRAYRPYYHGRTYHRAHRHHHAIYRFPVYTEIGLVYRPYAYCNGGLYRGHVSYNGPRFSLGVSY